MSHGTAVKALRVCEGRVQGLEAQLEAADALAKAVATHLRFVFNSKSNVSVGDLENAIAAYAKARASQ